MGIDETTLQQHSDVFYSRMSEQEAKAVHEIVDEIARFMKRDGHVPFLIAGVGGVLRLADPAFAEDIDLAVVGLRPQPKEGEKSFEAFTRAVYGFYEEFLFRERASYGDVWHGRGSGFIGRGSGPFSGLDEGFAGGNEKDGLSGRTNLEDFGFWRSKGFSVRHGSLRPIDIQFSAVHMIDEWKRYQEELHDPTEHLTIGAGTLFPVLKDPLFYYAELAKSD